MSTTRPPISAFASQPPARRPVTAVTLGALLTAATISGSIGAAGLRRARPIPGPDFSLADLVPGVKDDTVTWGTPGAGYPFWNGLAMAAILIGLPLVAALPLLACGRTRLMLLVASTLLVWSFALLTVSRAGLLYIPAAALLLIALVLALNEQRACDVTC